METVYSVNKSVIRSILRIQNNDLLEVLETDYNQLYLSARHPSVLFLSYLGLSVIYFFIKILYRLNSTIKAGDDEFTFFSCPDVIFRVKNLPLISSNCRYTIIFLPTFHVKSVVEYHKYFRARGIRTVFLEPRIRDVFACVKNRLEFAKEYSSLVCNNKRELLRLKTQLFTYIFYKSIAERSLADVTTNKIVFEHQKFFFIPFVCWFKDRGVPTYLLQHGSFFSLSYNYFPLLCDVVLCCSHREKNRYLENGIREDRIRVFGAPLQCLTQDTTGWVGSKIHYKYLVLLTFVTEENKSFQGKVLDYFRYSELGGQVLVRLRPRSAVEDLRSMGALLSGIAVSKRGTSLADDVSKADCIVSFSEDCVFELCRSGHPFLIASSSRSIDPLLDGKYCTEENYYTKLEDFRSCPEKYRLSSEEMLYLFGDLSLDSLSDKYAKFVRERQ